MKDECRSKNKKRIATLTKDVNRNKTRLDKLNSNKAELYIDYKNNILSLDDYSYMKDKFGKDISRLQDETQVLAEQIISLQNNTDMDYEYIKLFKSYKGIEKLDRQLIVRLIKKIIINKDKNLDIIFKFQNPLNKYLSYLDK